MNISRSNKGNTENPSLLDAYDGNIIGNKKEMNDNKINNSENENLKNIQINFLNENKTNENFKNSNHPFSLPEPSPIKYYYRNNLLISPTVDFKTTPAMNFTPQRIGLNYPDIPISTVSQLPIDFRDMKIESPFTENIVKVLKYDEKSSSFKRINLDNFSSNIFGRNINFDNNIVTNNIHDIEYFNKNDDGNRKRNSINNYSNYNKNTLTFKMNFSSEESSSEYGESDEDLHNKVLINRDVNYSKDLCCTCTKSRCLKKYCECYANKKYCAGCECQNCYNIPKFKELIKRSLEFSSSKNKDDETLTESQKVDIVCNCTKSNCTKKYCECFKAGEICKDNCRCINCLNNIGKELNLNQKKKEILSEEEKEKRKISRNPVNFIIEGTSVFIYNEDISIVERKELPSKKLGSNKLNICNTSHISSPPCDRNSNVSDLSENKNRNSKIFEVNSNFNLINNNSNETPKAFTKKRKRINLQEGYKSNSNIKCVSTKMATPIFNTCCTSEKSSHLKNNIKIDKNIVKKLDKIY